MESKTFDFAIIGAGIIGLSVAMKISSEIPNVSVVVLEKEQKIASHQTGHNSGVIHAGIYYAPGSQKASFCIRVPRHCAIIVKSKKFHLKW